MSGVIIQIPQLEIVLYLSTVLNNKTDFTNLSTIETLKSVINKNNVFTTAVRNAELMAGINYTLTNSQTNTLIADDKRTLSELGLEVSQWPTITLKFPEGGGRKSSTRRRRRSSKRRIRRKKRTRKRRTKRRSRRRHTRRKRKN